MKRLLSIFLIVSLLFCLTACKKKNQTAATVDSTPGNPTQSTDSVIQTGTIDSFLAVSVPTETLVTTNEDGVVLFQYTYQNISAFFNKPEVADKIVMNFLNRVDRTNETARSVEEQAKNAYNGSANWVPYMYHITYSPTRIDDAVLSFSGNNVVFNGAPHPERTGVSANYDMQTGDILTLASIMDMTATVDTLCNLVLAGLVELAEGDYLYENYKNLVTSRFAADPTTDEAWYFSPTGLCFYFDPYEIAPYSSGTISVEIPYEKLHGVIHADYIPKQLNLAQCNVAISDFDVEHFNQFAHSAEIVTNKDGNMYMIETDGAIQDVRITLSDSTGNYTIFAANGLTADNGIMLQAKDELLKDLKLSYKTNDEIQVKTFG